MDAVCTYIRRTWTKFSKKYTGEVYEADFFRDF